MSWGGWRVSAASAIGTSHLKMATPCQDSHGCRLLHDARGEPILLLVVSDGAGSASRSDEGSALACATLMDCVEDFLARGGRLSAVDRPMAQSWLTQAQRRITSRAEECGATPRDFACTLLAAIIAPDMAAFLQVGDGAMIASDPNGGWAWVHWPQRGEFANTTFFITEASASEQLAFDMIRMPVHEVAAFSDGIESLVLHYATQSVHAPFFDKIFGPVRALEQEGVDARLSASLERYLQSPAICERTDDDKTLVLASRRAALLVEDTPKDSPA